MKEKYAIQEGQYAFPYHYLTQLEAEDSPSIGRTLPWGFEYLTYMSYVRDQVCQLRPASILDVGCGDGWLLNSITSQPLDGWDPECRGIDLSSKALSFARAFSTGAQFDEIPAAEVTQQYDVVCLIEVLEHIPIEEIPQFVRDVVRAVKPGGYLIASVPTSVVPVHPKHYRHYDEGMLGSHLELEANGLEIVTDQRLYRDCSSLKWWLRFMNNRVFSVTNQSVIDRFWRWHTKNSMFAGQADGQHLVRVCRKLA